MSHLVVLHESIDTTSPHRQLAIACYQAESWRVLSVQGDIDDSSVTFFEEQLSAVDSCRFLVLDLEGVTSFDVVGFAVLLTTRAAIRAAGGQLRVVIGNHAVHLLDALRHSGTWPIYSSVASATKAASIASAPTTSLDVEGALYRLMHAEMTTQR